VSLQFDPELHEYAWNGRLVPSVTQVLRSALGDPFRGVASDVFERKRQIGSAAHKACELDALGTLDESTVHPAVVPYLEAWRAFLRESNFQVYETETHLYSDAYGFAGTPDFIGVLGGANMCVIDLKTGLPMIQAAFQTAGYAILAGEIGNSAMVSRYALQALPNGRYKLMPYTAPSDFADFLACLRCHRIKERMVAHGHS
jgi:hypothetical protein